jgi:hypothetical protein
MNRLPTTLLRLHLTFVVLVSHALGTRRRDERGDVPGWVMVTVMTAGLVVLLWGAAKEQLGAMLSNALGSVKQ